MSNNVAQEKEMTYEEELKLFREKWAKKRAKERSEKREAEKAEERKANSEKVGKALEILNTLPANAVNELKPAITRLEMYTKGERYTRNKGDK